MGSADTEEGASASSRRSVTCERGMRVKMASRDAEEGAKGHIRRSARGIMHFSSTHNKGSVKCEN